MSRPCFIGCYATERHSPCGTYATQWPGLISLQHWSLINTALHPSSSKMSPFCLCFLCMADAKSQLKMNREDRAWVIERFFWCQLTWVVLDKRPLDGLLLLLSFLASFKLSLKTAALFVDYLSGSGRAIGLACVSLFLNNNFWTEWHLMYLAWFILTYHTLHWKVDIIG